MTKRTAILWALVVLGWAACGGRAAPTGVGLEKLPVQEPEIVPLPEPPPVDPPEEPEEPVDRVADDVGSGCDLSSTPSTTESLLLNPRSRSCRSSMCLHVRGGLAHCTDFCGEDADCPASGPNCPGGFVCIAPFVVGKPACCRMCVCGSALVPEDLRFSEVSCADRGCGITGE